MILFDTVSDARFPVPSAAAGLAVALVFAGSAPSGVASPVPGDTPIELGTVRWTRSYQSGLAMARQSDRDLLMLFQEVPG